MQCISPTATPACFEEGQLEGDVVGNNVDPSEQVENAGAGAIQVNDEDMVVAGMT